jgi:hypothetical protein
MHHAAKAGGPFPTDYVAAALIIMAIAFGPAVTWLLGL